MLDSRVLVASSALLLAAGTAPAAEKLKPEQLVQAHLEEGLGPAEARSRARLVRGATTLTARAVGEGQLSGAFQLASDAQGARLFVHFGTNEYEGETFAFDGRDVEIGFGQRPTGRRSDLGSFVAQNQVILRDGLLGGVLNAGWALATLDARQPMLSSDGMKKLDGRALHRLGYRARKGQNDLTVHLYFEPGSFRHVASVYTASLAQSMGATPEASSQQSDVHFRLEERFDDFRKALGLTLPGKWTLRYEVSARTTREWTYELVADQLEAR